MVCCDVREVWVSCVRVLCWVPTDLRVVELLVPCVGCGVCTSVVAERAVGSVGRGSMLCVCVCATAFETLGHSAAMAVYRSEGSRRATYPGP